MVYHYQPLRKSKHLGTYKTNMKINSIYQGDSIETLRGFPDESVDCVITSPPYWGLRDYGNDGQIGLEKTPEEYVAKLVELFREVKRVLKKQGTLWLNLGDSYANTKEGNTETNKNPKVVTKSFKKIRPANLKPKDLVGIPWRVAFALQANGWYLRQDIIWAKPNPMPESVTDRCTKSHEYIFLLTKSAKYYFDNEAIKEPSVYPEDNRKSRVNEETAKDFQKEIGNVVTAGDKTYPFRNRRDVWNIATMPYSEAHFATFPEKLIEPMILSGCPKGGIILDPFMGAGTTGLVAKKQSRNYVGCELNPEYIKIAEERINGQTPPFL